MGRAAGDRASAPTNEARLGLVAGLRPCESPVRLRAHRAGAVTGIDDIEGPPIPLFEITARCWKWDCKGCGPGRRVEAYKMVKGGIDTARAAHPNGVSARFLTITYPNSRDLRLEKPGDLRAAHRDQRRFVKQLRRSHGRAIEYVTVTEPTKRGRIHFHLILSGPIFLRKCTDPGRRARGLRTGAGSGSPCYCSDAKPCLQRLAWAQGMGWVKVEAVRSSHKGGAYLSKYLAKGAGGHRWPKYARRMSVSRGWGKETFASIRRAWIEELRAKRRADGESVDLPDDPDLVYTIVPRFEPPFGVDRKTGEVFLPSRLR